MMIDFDVEKLADFSRAVVEKLANPCKEILKSGDFDFFPEHLNMALVARVFILFGMIFATKAISKAVKKREQKDKTMTKFVMGASAAVIASILGIAITVKSITNGRTSLPQDEVAEVKKQTVGVAELVLISAFCAAAISGRSIGPNNTQGRNVCCY